MRISDWSSDVCSSDLWLDCRADRLLYKAIDLPWERPKLIANAGRLSRGPWRIAAMLDKDGLLCSQQFFGLWPHETVSDVEILTFARSEEHTSELPSLLRISYAVFCLKKKKSVKCKRMKKLNEM